MRSDGSKILNQEIVELVAQVFIARLLREMAQEQCAQHLFFPKTLVLQYLAHLGDLQLPIDRGKPILDSVEHFPLRAIDGVFQLFAMSNVELEFSNQSRIESVEPSGGPPFSSDLDERHGSVAHNLIIQLAISFAN